MPIGIAPTRAHPAFPGAPDSGDDVGVASLIIEDENELRALHKMLYMRKFDGPEDECFGSPYIASVQRRLVEALRGFDMRPWDDWLNAAAHEPEVSKVRAHLIANRSKLAALSEDERRTYIADLLAPLLVGTDLMGELVEASGE